LSRDEDLIAHGWPEDVWFHVDNLSSAHVYLRLPDPANAPWTAIPTDLLTDCAQLTKANSIDGNKKDNITVIYTPWSNLKKTGDMATGQVGFKDQKMVRKVHVERRENAVVNRLNKTRVEKFPDLRAEKADKEREERKQERIAAQAKVC
jgi:predicted ribosome quality control (RQC) complex YloA/Tae2 family protein